MAATMNYLRGSKIWFQAGGFGVAHRLDGPVMIRVNDQMIPGIFWELT